MNEIHVLDQITIDKIAAGEVIERPASVVKELVENAIDAGATAITVEIKDGGISFIRISDNGSGIEPSQVPAAFLRHSTSKIQSVDDLTGIRSLGFRGEALSSIAAVAQVELLTKTKEASEGTRYVIAGGKEESFSPCAAPDGTTFFVRQLFYNTPARRKFLKTAMTEASHINDLMMRMALSRADISFQFIINGSSKIHTSGDGNLKNVIYQVYGRDITKHLIAVDCDCEKYRLSGFIGEPIISRGNRNFENYFINHRYIKSNLLSKALEDGYKDFSMQHRFPFAVLEMDVKGEEVDVNVHPTKMDVRFYNQQEVYNFVYDAVLGNLKKEELIPQVELDHPKESKPANMANRNRVFGQPYTSGANNVSANSVRESGSYNTSSGYGSSAARDTAAGDSEKGKAAATSFTEAHQEKAELRMPPSSASEEEKMDYFMEKMRQRVISYHEKNSSAEIKGKGQIFNPVRNEERVKAVAVERKEDSYAAAMEDNKEQPDQAAAEKPRQMDLFDDHLIKREIQAEFRIVGQVFETYWIIEYKDNMYIIDQHAAHERVLYEKTLRGMKERQFTSQMISPPLILELSMQERELLKTYMDQFTSIGFVFEEFGQDTYTVTAVPDNLFSIAKKELLLDMLDGLSDELNRRLPVEIIDEKIASMSCKAAVKGNMRLSEQEVKTLIGELLTLENPFHCPHGRPTIIAMSKREMEKKFKRIV